MTKNYHETNSRSVRQGNQGRGFFVLLCGMDE